MKSLICGMSLVGIGIFLIGTMWLIFHIFSLPNIIAIPLGTIALAVSFVSGGCVLSLKPGKT